MAWDIPVGGWVLHLDAAHIRGAVDGAPLDAGWEDPSGDLRSASGPRPPIYLADGGGGYPAVRFNGVDQYLEVAVPTASEASVFIVFAHRRSGLPPNYRDTLITATGSGSTINLASSRSVTSPGDYPSFNAVANDGVGVRTWVNGHDTMALSGDIFRGQYVVGSAVYTALPAREGLLIGTRGTGGFNAGQNDIREILIYDRALSDEERQAVQRHLGSKYDLVGEWWPPDHPVERFVHPLGSQQFGTHYSHGESGIIGLDYARATLRQGNRVVKFRLSNRYASEDGFTADARIQSLATLVRDQPEVKAILDLPLTDYVFWVSSFSVPSWQDALDANGLKATARDKIYAEVYDVAVYLLTTYSGTGKRFYLGNWEGDWMLAGSYRDDPTTIPANRIQGMIDWANTRQAAIDDAKAATSHHAVELWFYLEMNKADWMRSGLPCVANSVIPAMPKLDMVSISSYSIHKDPWGGQRNRALVHADLDRVQQLLEAKPDPSISGSRLMIGEYGWIYNASRYGSLENFAATHRTTVRNFMSWPGGTLRFILQWQFFNQATVDATSTVSKEMNQISPENSLRPLYHMHANFYRLMRRWVEDAYLRTGEVPSAEAYAGQATHLLESELVSLSPYNPIVIHSRFDTWRAHHFPDAMEGSQMSISGPEADPYRSGLSNLMRYALNLGKFRLEHGRLPQLRWSEGALVYAVPYDGSKTDLRWVIQATSDLRTWPIPLHDSTTDAMPEDGWLEVSGANQVAPGDPVFYRLTLQQIP